MLFYYLSFRLKQCVYIIRHIIQQYVDYHPRDLSGHFVIIPGFRSDERKTTRQEKDQLSKFKRGSKTTGLI